MRIQIQDFILIIKQNYEIPSHQATRLHGMRSHLPSHDRQVLWQGVLRRDDAKPLRRHPGGSLHAGDQRCRRVHRFPHDLWTNDPGEDGGTTPFPLYPPLEPGSLRCTL